MKAKAKRAGWEKFSTYLKPGQRQQLRLLALQEGKEVREVVSALIQKWLDKEVSL